MATAYSQSIGCGFSRATNKDAYQGPERAVIHAQAPQLFEICSDNTVQ